MAGPWTKYGGSDAPVASQPPAVIYGEVDPFKVSSEQRAERSAERQDAAAIRAAEASDRAAAAAARAAENDARKLAAEERKLAAGGGIEATESERTAAFLATRVANGLETLKGIGTGGDATLGTRVAEALPFGLGNYLVGNDRQRAATAQLDVLDAALTLGTGAAYTKEQLEGYRQSYFPQPGDGPDVVADKQERLKVLLEAARVKAGAAAPAIDRALSNAGVGEEGDGTGDRNTLVSAVRRPDGQFDLTWGDGRKEVADSIPFSSGATADVDASQVTGISDAQRDTALGGVQAFSRGVADTITLGFNDEIRAGVDTVFSGGDYSSNLNRQRAIDAQDERLNPYARLGGQIAGGFVLPTGGATGAAGLARVGALYGAGYGAGSAEGSAYDRLVGGIGGGVIGGATGGALGAVGSRLAARGGGGGPAGGSGASDLMAAAQRQGVDVLPADVGGPMTRRFSAGVSQSPFGAGRITQAVENRDAQFAGRVRDIASAEGAPVRQEVLGETARTAAQRYIDNSAAEGRRLYEGARGLAEGVTITPANAVANIDAQLAELAPTSNTDAPLIAGLQRLRADLANGDTPNSLSVDAIRRLRTSTRTEAQSEGLRASDYQRRAGLVLDDLAEDIASQLPPEAAQAFRRADQAWSERLNVIDDTMSAILGPKDNRSAEGVANRLSKMARGDSARLRTFVDNLTPEEGGIVRGSLINDLGRAASGQQGAEGSAFSLNTFLTNWDRLPDRTKSILFRGDSRAAIEDLARIAEGARGSAKYTNTSNTSGAGHVLSTLAGVLSLGTSIPVEYMTGRLLASPRFARWLARPPRDSRASIRRLEQIAVREPVLAPDIAPFIQALQQSPGRVAAATQDENQ